MTSPQSPSKNTHSPSYISRFFGRGHSNPTRPEGDPGVTHSINPDAISPSIQLQLHHSPSRVTSSQDQSRLYSNSAQHGIIQGLRDSSHPLPTSNVIHKPDAESAFEGLSLEDPNRSRHSQFSDSMRNPVKRLHHDGDQSYPNKHGRSSASPFSSPHNPNPGSIRTHSPPSGFHSAHQSRQSSPQTSFTQPHRPAVRQSYQPLSLEALKASERKSSSNVVHSTIVYDPPLEQDTKMVLQPETRPITQEQLVNEVKGIYSGLIMVEKKCVEIDLQQSQTNNKLSKEQYQALIALHRTLLHEHHDFFLASQHPTASPALRRLPTKYAMPARMWRHAIHSFLELLRHRLPASLEFMLSFVYLAYQMMGLLMESVPAFYETWIECLGDLARYRMAIEESDMRDRENWSNVARMWYNRAADRSPMTGRVQHHLAVLARPNVIRQLFFYSKSLTSVIPFVNARDSIMLLFTQFLEGDTASQKYTRIERAMVTAAAIVFTRGSIHAYNCNILEFTEELDSQITRSGSNFKVVGAEIASSLISLILDFGHDENFLFKAFRENHEKIRALPDSKSQPIAPQEHRAEDHVLKKSIHRTFWEENGPINAQDFPQVPPHGGDRHDAKFESSDEVTSYIIPIWSSCISTVCQKVGDRNILPFMHITLAFVWSLSYVPGALIYLERYVPWSSIVLCLNTLSRSGVSDSRIEDKAFPQQSSGTGRQLPEDFLIRGLTWAPYYFPENFFHGQIVDEDERTLELPSHAAPRAERILWLGHKISELGRYISYDMETKEFSVAPYASSLVELCAANALSLNRSTGQDLIICE